MKTTIPLPEALALTVARFQNPTPSRRLGGSFHEAHFEECKRIAAGDFLREITITRGQRLASTIIPANMLAPMQASEARAWSHSPLAGALWEIGFRASRAIALAENV